MSTDSQSDSSASLPLTLYCVELPWNASDSEQGTYTAFFWATSEEAAIKKCVAEMGREEPDDELDDDIEDNAVVEVVMDTVVGWAQELIAGPKSTWTPEAEADLKEMKRIARKYADLHATAHTG